VRDDVIGTICILAYAAWFGWELHKRMSQSPSVVYLPAPPPPPLHQEQRASQALCRCEKCAPPFLQEADGEH
jgi:hypothetical protein